MTRLVCAGIASLFAVVLCTHSRVTAQDFSSAVDAVTLNVRVTRDGAYVGGLAASAFTVLEDGTPQTITLFASQDTPATVGVIVDSSISVYAMRDTLVEGASALAASANPGDEFFGIAFNEESWPVLPVRQPFTSDVNVLRDALNVGIRPRGRTGLYDAIAAGLRYAARGSLSRRVLVVVSDGGDNASHATLAQVIAATRASDVVLYAVALIDPIDDEARPDVLKHLAAQSGGESFVARNATEVRAAIERIARDIRHTYTLGYVPPNAADGAFHRLRVVVASPDRRRVVVSTRDGYTRHPIDERPDVQ